MNLIGWTTRWQRATLHPGFLPVTQFFPIADFLQRGQLEGAFKLGLPTGSDSAQELWQHEAHFRRRVRIWKACPNEPCGILTVLRSRHCIYINLFHTYTLGRASVAAWLTYDLLWYGTIWYHGSVTNREWAVFSLVQQTAGVQDRERLAMLSWHCLPYLQSTPSGQFQGFC